MKSLCGNYSVYNCAGYWVIFYKGVPYSQWYLKLYHSECKLVKPEVATVQDFTVPHQVCKMSIPDSHSLRDKFQQSESINRFIEQSKCKSVLVFTDGSVYNGCDSCASVLFPLRTMRT